MTLDMAIKALEKQPCEGNVCKDCYYNDEEVHAECVICDKAENEEKIMKWKLFREDATCVIYQYEPSREAIYELFFDKETCTCNYTLKHFVRNSEVMTPQDAENDWISHSAKYGHWEYEHPRLDIDVLEFILPVIKELNQLREMRNKE